MEEKMTPDDAVRAALAEATRQAATAAQQRAAELAQQINASARVVAARQIAEQQRSR